MTPSGGTTPAGMDCRQVGELLQPYLDGQVDADRAQLIEQHLGTCGWCETEAETYARIKATLARLRIELPAESVERLREFGQRLARDEEPAPGHDA
jgi:anti-sigma factor RsiW